MVTQLYISLLIEVSPSFLLLFLSEPFLTEIEKRRSYRDRQITSRSWRKRNCYSTSLIFDCGHGGADLKRSFSQDEDGNTPLDLARLADHEELVTLLSDL